MVRVSAVNEYTSPTHIGALKHTLFIVLYKSAPFSIARLQHKAALCQRSQNTRLAGSFLTVLSLRFMQLQKAGRVRVEDC